MWRSSNSTPGAYQVTYCLTPYLKEPSAHFHCLYRASCPFSWRLGLQRALERFSVTWDGHENFQIRNQGSQMHKGGLQSADPCRVPASSEFEWLKLDMRRPDGMTHYASQWCNFELLWQRNPSMYLKVLFTFNPFHIYMIICDQYMTNIMIFYYPKYFGNCKYKISFHKVVFSYRFQIFKSWT